MDTPTSGLASIGLFFKEIIANPAPVGAAAPSGPILGMRMAMQVPVLKEGQHVVELGAGTGAITTQLLKSGIDGKQLVSIERSEAMSSHLRNRFPLVKVIQGDASRLKKLLEDDLSQIKLHPLITFLLHVHFHQQSKDQDMPIYPTLGSSRGYQDKTLYIHQK